MIQTPKSDEVLVDVPPDRCLLDLHPSYLNRVFAGLLLRGRRSNSGRNAVEWLLASGQSVVPGESPAARRAAEILRERCEVASRLHVQLDELLKRASKDAVTLPVPPDALAELGGSADRGGGRLPVSDLRVLRDALPRAVAAVRRAIEQGNFVARDGQAMLYGWCFLPSGWKIGVVVPTEPPVAKGDSLPSEPRPGMTASAPTEVPVPAPVPSIRLAYRDAVETRGTGSVSILEWAVDGRLPNIRIDRVDGDGRELFRGPEELGLDDRSGRFEFPGPSLNPGSEYEAVSRIDGREVRSNRVRVPDRPLPPPVPPLEPPGLCLRGRRLWAVWGPCACCRRLGLGSLRGCLASLLAIGLALLAIWLLSTLLTSCWPATFGLGTRVVEPGDGPSGTGGVERETSPPAPTSPLVPPTQTQTPSPDWPTYDP
jgi:hypothetical protein